MADNNDYDQKMADMEAFLDAVPGMPSAPRQQRPPQQSNDGVREINVENELMKRLGHRMGQGFGNDGAGVDISGLMAQPQNQPAPAQQQQHRMVYLKEGVTYYKLIPADMSTIPVAMKAGPVSNVVGKEFVFKGTKQCYIVENHAAIDLSNIDHSACGTLVAIEAPWTGVILVHESSIVNVSQRPSTPQVLKG